MLDLAEKTLKYVERFVSYAEIRAESAVEKRIILKNSNVEAIDTIHASGMCIRILKDGILSSTFVNKPDFTFIKKSVQDAIKTAEASQFMLKKPVKLSIENFDKTRYDAEQKIKLENISIEERLREMLDIDKALLGLKIPLRYLEITDEIKNKYYVNSDGARIRSFVPRLKFEYMITAIQGNKNEQRNFMFGGSGGWENFKRWNLLEHITHEAKVLKKLLRAPSPPKEKVDIVLSPELVGIATHESTGHPYESDRILGREAAQAGESFVTPNLLRTRIGSDVVNLVDDPTLPGSYGFYLYDDEGVKAQRRFLIKNGMINDFLMNRETATEFNTKSNGAAWAENWTSEPIVRMANTFVLPGDHKFDELIEDIKKGVYIKSYMEWNIDDKRFNQRYVGSECYLISNGEIKGLVKKPVLEITTPSFWQSIDAVGNDLGFISGTCGKGEPLQGIPVWFGGPHIRLRNIKLG